MKAIALHTWAGTRYYPVNVIGETRTRLRCELLLHHSINLPGRRVATPGEPFLVPKDAVREVRDDDERLERGMYHGRIYGYGGSVDAVRPYMTCGNCGHYWRASHVHEGCWHCNSREKLADCPRAPGAACT